MIKVKDNFLMSNGKPLGVFMSMKEYRKLIEKAEDLEDIKDFDAAISSKAKFIPWEVAIKQIKRNRRLRK